MKITEEEQNRRRDQILNTAFRLFCKKGIEKVTLSDIAQGAQVGDSTIYRYFKNKVQLVLSTLSVLWKAIGQKLEEAVEATDHFEKKSGFEQLAIRLHVWEVIYLENTDYVLFSYEAKLYLQRNGVIITSTQYDELMDHIKPPCIATIQRGIADGSIPVHEDPEDLFYAIWGSVRGYVVKIVLYKALCGINSPWEKRYHILEQGLLSALQNGWSIKERG